WQAPDKRTGFQPNNPEKLDFEAPADYGAVTLTDRTVLQTDVEPPVRWLLPVVPEDDTATVPLLFSILCTRVDFELEKQKMKVCFLWQAFDVLGRVEAYLKLLKSEGLSLPVLAARHEELHREIKDCTADALQKGQTLISQGDSCSSRVTGVRDMMGCIQRRVGQLTEQCSAHEELALKKQQLTASVKGYLRKVEMSFEKISPALSSAMDVGSSLLESEKILSEYLKLDIQAKETSQELEAAAKLMTEKNELEPDEVASLSSKAKWLEVELKILGQSIGYRLRVLQTYVAFLQSSEEVEERCQSLKDFYQTEILWKEEGDAEARHWSDKAEKEWHLFLKRSFLTQDLGLQFINLINMTTYHLKLLQEALMPVSELDLGGSLQTILGLQKKWNEMKPQFQQLNDEVQYLIKQSEELSGRGAPVKEKSQQLKALVHLHQEQKGRLQGGEDILHKVVWFHQVTEELEHLIKSRQSEFLEQPKELHDAQGAQAHLDRFQEEQAHIDHLHKLALSLGTEIISSVQRLNCFNVSAKNLQQQLDILEGDSVNWRAEAREYEQTLIRNLEYCTTRDDVTELKESFKDIKKKFNNLKFNYTKKNEKARNLKALKYQIQQVDTYAEKLQALKRKIDRMETKPSDYFLNYPNKKVDVLLEAMKDLQKHVDEFDKVVTDYRKNLDLTEHLQEMIEECHFWCEDASATVVRVGKYSMECKTKKAVEILHQQFNKFITPSVPQQEERIQEISDIAQRLYGVEEGQKYAEKIVAKHKDVLESITELCVSLTELEEKLKGLLCGTVPPTCLAQAFTHHHFVQQGDVFKMNVNLEDFHDDGIDLLKEPVRNKQTIFREERNKEQAQVTDILAISGRGEDRLPQDLSSGKQGGVRGPHQPTDLPSGEEYDCVAPDGISLPPLPGSPEHPPAPSDMEVDQHASPTTLGLHTSSCPMQTGASQPREARETGLPPPAAFADACDYKRETFSSHFERPYPQFKAELPLTSQGFLEESTAFCKINAKHPESMPSEVHERALQQPPQAQESLLETWETMHADNNVTKTPDRMHVLQDAFSGFGFQSGPRGAYQRQMAPREEIKSTSAKNSMVSLAGQAPSFSRLLSNVTVMEGSPVTLEVEVTGSPEPTLTWFKKGQKLSSDGHLQVLHKETRHLVFIPKACEADAGLYVAQAQNSSGIFSSNVILHVTDVSL
ncbi:hypothetical protein MC885_016700, partial [Smutsia gigantea]